MPSAIQDRVLATLDLVRLWSISRIGSSARVEESSTLRAVMRLASERPEWVPVLRAACVCAERAERFDGEFAGEFAGAWVLSELKRETGEGWRPGLRTLATFGLLEKSGESVRGGRRAYYRMPDRSGVEAALAELQHRKLIGKSSARRGGGVMTERIALLKAGDIASRQVLRIGLWWSRGLWASGFEAWNVGFEETSSRRQRNAIQRLSGL